MKRFAFLLSALLCIDYASAQVAQWLVPPEYDDIVIPRNANVIVARQGYNHHIWNMDGKCIEKVTDDLYPYSEGYAVSTKTESADITAIYDANGQKTPITDPLQLGWGYTSFHDGFLLVHDGHYFYYMDFEGGVDPTAYYRAYPFSHGYAATFTFENMRKMKDPVYRLLNTELQPVQLSFEGKPLRTGDIEFISSVSDKGKAVVVAKGKLYYFDAATAELSPLLPPDDTNLKNQAHLDGSLDESLKSRGDSLQVLTAKSGKSRLTVTFDAITLKPTVVKSEVNELSLSDGNVTRSRGSLIKGVRDDATRKYALQLNGNEILPPQFDAVDKCEGDNAWVVVDNRMGLLRVHSDGRFSLVFNNGEDMGIRHKHFYTTLRLNMPSYVDAQATSIEIDPETGCSIDKATKEAKNTNEGSYVQYRCALTCPPDVGDEPQEYSYPAYIIYQGLRTPMTTATGKAWHSKYFTVDVNEKEVTLQHNTLSFTVNVSAERLQDEDVVPFIPSLATDDMRYDMEKVSDTRYKCKVYDLKPGRNNIIVRVEEEGCPPADYTFEVDNTPKTQGNKVTMTKKQVTTPKQPAKPVLRI